MDVACIHDVDFNLREAGPDWARPHGIIEFQLAGRAHVVRVWRCSDGTIGRSAAAAIEADQGVTLWDEQQAEDFLLRFHFAIVAVRRSAGVESLLDPLVVANWGAFGNRKFFVADDVRRLADLTLRCTVCNRPLDEDWVLDRWKHPERLVFCDEFLICDRGEPCLDEAIVAFESRIQGRNMEIQQWRNARLALQQLRKFLARPEVWGSREKELEPA